MTFDNFSQGPKSFDNLKTKNLNLTNDFFKKRKQFYENKYDFLGHPKTFSITPNAENKKK
jgi:hypothetical protein